MYKQSGVSLMEVIIVIIVMIIIASISIMSGQSANNEAKATDVYAEMKSVYDSVQYTIFKLDSLDDFILVSDSNCGHLLSSADKTVESITSNNDYYYLYSESDRETIGSNMITIMDTIEENMGIGPLRRTYIVCYETGEVMLKNALKIGGTFVRTFEEVKNVIDTGDITK